MPHSDNRLLRLAPRAATVVGLLACGLGPLAARSSAQDSCQVNADFAAIVSRIGPAVVGDCLSAELVASQSGDRFQATSRGLLILSNAGSWTAFTDGQTTWINSAAGLAIAGPSQSQSSGQMQQQTQPSPAQPPQKPVPALSPAQPSAAPPA